MSSFFTAIVFWAILKWDVEDDEYHLASEDIKQQSSSKPMDTVYCLHDRVFDRSSLIELLAIPAIVFVVYFKKYSFTWKSFIWPGTIPCHFNNNSKFHYSQNCFYCRLGRTFVYQQFRTTV